MNSIICGAQFGDEAKGLVTSWLCSKTQHPMVVRFSGGPQAGHTVIHNDIRHVFSNFGSGTLQGVPTLWSKYCPFFPTSYMNELRALQGYGLKSKFFIHPRCPVTTPFEILENRANYSLAMDNGSCGMGVGQTWQREEDHYKLCVQDLFFETVLTQKLKHIHSYYSKHPPHQEIMTKFIEDCKEVLNFLKLTSLYDISDSYDLIFEGSQGILLDQDHGFFPNVTRSNTTSKNALEIIKEAGDLTEYIDIYYVIRSYQTRHGNGFMTGTSITIDAPDETNKFNQFQGAFRTTTLDYELLAYAIKSDMLYHENFHIRKNLVITCMDQHKIDINFLLETLRTRWNIHFENVYTSYGPRITDIKQYYNV